MAIFQVAQLLCHDYAIFGIAGCKFRIAAGKIGYLYCFCQPFQKLHYSLMVTAPDFFVIPTKSFFMAIDCLLLQRNSQDTLDGRKEPTAMPVYPDTIPNRMQSSTTGRSFFLNLSTDLNFRTLFDNSVGFTPWFTIAVFDFEYH